MVNIIKNEQGKAIGWEITPTTPEEQEIACTIRDLQFFGFGDTYPEYNGLELIDPEKGKQFGNLKRISWLQKKYHNS